MADEWEELPIGDIAEIFDGPHATPAKTVDGPIFLGISNLVGGRIDLSEIEHLSENDFVRWTRRVEPKPGDVVFSYETRLGEAASVPRGLRCCLGRRMGLLRARGGRIDERFLLYAYLGPQFQETLRSRTIHGSTVDRIPLLEMADFPIRIPKDVKRQRAIAHILGTLDDKIELNRRMNATLEEMARALFKSWFVDFDPVRAMAEGRETGLPEEIAGLFPDGFEETAVGAVPRGWRVGTLAGLANLNPESWSQNTAPTDIEYLDLTNTKWGKIEDTQRFVWTEAPSRARRILRPGDTVVGTVRPGNGAYALIAGEGLTGSTGFAVLRPRSTNYTEIVYFVVTAADNIARLSHLADGGAYPAVRPGIVLDSQTILPNDQIAKAFANMVRPMMARITANEHESRTLAALRDTLLPKLISGELRVGEAERFIQGVTE